VLALVLAAAAGADTVSNSGSSITVVAGGSAVSVSYSIGDDGDGVCDAADGTAAVVTINAPAGIDASPGSLTFADCGTSQSVAFSAGASTTSADYPVSAGVTDAGGGAYDASPASLTVHVDPAPDTTPPVLSLPAPISGEATSAATVVVYTATATDNVDGAVSVSCNPPSGAGFPKGVTNVSCSATDSSNNTATGSFTVTLNDVQAPVLALPSPPPAEATGPTGAVVTYTASATDNVDSSVGVSCNPPSGTTFGKGQTTVTCSAQDSSGNTSQPGTFVVTVQDTQPPTLSLSSPAPVEATSSAGATVTFGATATDTVDGNRPVTCNPSSGSTFSIGSTTVNCTAGDTSGNNAAGTLTVSVTDAGPSVTMPPTQTAEANGPSGAPVTYAPAPLGSDVVDGPLPVTCSKASGSIFPLGQTTVTCTATDSKGTSATGSFQVNVVDTTRPIVTAPPAATFVAEGSSLSRSFPALAAYLARGRAADLVDPNPTLFVDAPLFFPLGPSVVTYTAVDGAGNRDSATTTITIVPPPPPGQPLPPPPPPDDPPPANVTALRATPGNALVRLAWTAPRDADVVRYAAFRSERTGPVVQVYNGAARSFVDRGLANGVEYRYVVVAYDRGGNRSVGVAVLATPRLPMLLAPRDGARLAKGTKFSWRRVAGARYYNFQLFRLGAAGRPVKILSVWPVTNSFQLRASWRFERRLHRLTPGTYRWFVWPGFGARADSRYGELLGERSFTITRRRR
jgi:HYR domain